MNTQNEQNEYVSVAYDEQGRVCAAVNSNGELILFGVFADFKKANITPKILELSPIEEPACTLHLNVSYDSPFDNFNEYYPTKYEFGADSAEKLSNFLANEWPERFKHLLEPFTKK